jgi:hypothetical protein
MTPRATRLAWTVWCLWAISAALAVGFLVLLGLDADLAIEGRALLGTHLTEAVDILPILGFATVGAFVASRQPQNRIGWIFCWAGFLIAVAVFSGEYAIRALIGSPGSLPGGDWATWVSNWLFIPALFLAGFLLLLLFPDGHLLTRRWVLALWIGVAGVGMLSLGAAFKPGPFSDDPFTFVTNPAGIEAAQSVFSALEGTGWAPFMLSFVLAAISLVLRFRRSGAEAREQIKWVTAASLFFFAAILAASFTYDLGTTVNTAVGILVVVALATIPVAAGVAILKYRLYEIDLLVRKTLVYGALTALLAGLYFGIVVALQQVFSGLAGGYDLAIAGSTLAVAALFRPARRRIQGLVDRRFYRRSYDRERILSAFSARLRDEIDLDALGAELRRVIDDTLAPAHVSAWLRQRSSGP